MSKFLKLRVGSTSYMLRIATIQRRCPNSFLNRFIRLKHEQRLKQVDFFCQRTGQYCFNRRLAGVFDTVFEYYLTGKLHEPTVKPCQAKYDVEMDFWKLPRLTFSKCCGGGRTSNRSSIASKRTLSIATQASKIQLFQKQNPFAGVPQGKIRKKIWNFLEVPSSSRAAKLFSFFTTTVVLLSIIGLILGSMPEMQVTDYQHDNTTVTHVMPSVTYTEYFCVTWFSAEYLVRLIVTPKRRKFIASPLNVIDLLTFLPFYLELLLEIFQVDTELRHVSNMMAMLRLLRLLRAARILKLARYNQELKSFGRAFRNSFQDLITLTVFLSTGAILFATVMYSLEKNVNPQFNSILSGCWWAVQTMIPIGFGDIVPVTTVGQIVGAITSVSGIVVLSIPISLIANIWRIHFKRQLRQREKNRHLQTKWKPAEEEDLEEEEFENSLAVSRHLPTVLV